MDECDWKTSKLLAPAYKPPSSGKISVAQMLSMVLTWGLVYFQKDSFPPNNPGYSQLLSLLFP